MRRFILRVVCPGVFAFPESAPKKHTFIENFVENISISSCTMNGPSVNPEEGEEWALEIESGWDEGEFAVFWSAESKFSLGRFLHGASNSLCRGKHQGKLLECEKNFPVLWVTSEKNFLFGCQPFRISQECAPSN